MQEVFNLSRGETAVICILLLRGPQTPGELRGRTERMHRFGDLDEVQSTLQRLMQREPPLLKVLPRQPGTKESRYMHLFSGEVETPQITASPVAAAATPNVDSRLALLETEVAALRTELGDLRQQLTKFREQFE